MFTQLTPDVKQKLLKNVFVLGGNTLVPGFDKRLYHELRMMTPANFPIKIVNELDSDRLIRPWLGAAKLSKQDSIYITKKEYDECGSHYLKEHIASNIMYGKDHKY